MSFFDHLVSGVKSAGAFVADHWKTIAVVGVGMVAYAAVVVATGGTAALLAPTLLELAAGGVAAGAAGQLTSDLLAGVRPGWDIAKAAVVGGVITVATAGLARFVPGLSAPLANPIAQRAVVTAAGSAGGAGAQVLSNALDERPLGDGVLQAAERGGVTTLLASEGVRIIAPRILTATSTEPTVTSTIDGTALSKETARNTAFDLRAKDGTPLTGKALDQVPRAVTAQVNEANGSTTVGVTGGALNATMESVLAAEGFDLAAMRSNLDVNAMRTAMRNPAVRAALDPRIADAILALPDSKLVAFDMAAGRPFLALPWNCAEVQALRASLAAGADPTKLVSSTVLARTNAARVAETGSPFKACARCEHILESLGVKNATDSELGGTRTDDTTAPTPRSAGLVSALEKVGN